MTGFTTIGEGKVPTLTVAMTNWVCGEAHRKEKMVGLPPDKRQQHESHNCTSMIKTCSKCGSTKVETINVEMAFARAKAEPVYVLAGNSVCLDCGFAECFLPQESLAKLRELVQV